MSPERWQRIEEAYHSALERAPDQRAAFLAEICGSDDELRREVESLLRQGESKEAFVDRPAWEAAGELLDTNTVDQTRELAGHRISHYEIVEKLGEGGRSGSQAALRAGSQGGLGAEPPQHRQHLRHRTGRQH